MRLFQNIIYSIWEKTLIIFGTLIVLIPPSPLITPLTTRDSGVFLYIGWRILNGDLPYRDVWDHKPPIIFYINALGLFITDKSRWGVWGLEFVSLFLAAFIGFQLIKKLFGIYSAVLSTLLWLITLALIIEGGNFTTEYTLLPQFAALYLIYDANKLNRPYSRLFLIGLIGGVAFFTKQTTIGIWVAILLYLINNRLKPGHKQWIKEVLIIASGFLIISAGWVIFFSLQGTLLQFISAAFLYNFAYSLSSTDLINRLQPILTSGELLTQTGLLQFSMIGYVIVLTMTYTNKNIFHDWSPLLFIGLIDVPIELILISVSGRTYLHYFITLLPTLSVFTGLTFWVIFSQLSIWDVKPIVKTLFVIGIIVVTTWASFNKYTNQIFTYSEKTGRNNIIRYIRSASEPDDYVLLWGAESAFNFYTKRKSPTRFVYQYPLYNKDYTSEQIILEFLDGVIQNHPKIIIDTKNSETPMYKFPIYTEAIKGRIAYLQSHYHIVKSNGDWAVYKYVKKIP